MIRPTSFRELGGAEDFVVGLGSAAPARAALGLERAAAALLTELESFPGARMSSYYALLLPTMMRVALGIGAPDLAGRLVASYETRYPYAEHALVAANVVAANAALTEARGNLQAAADAYAEAADRWERFGVVPEQAYALLGQGRCFLGLSRPTEASPVLHNAREIFKRLQAAPALAETDELQERATALSS